MIKVFISCSGDESRAVGELLREWLPNVIQAVQPWISTIDLEKGARWNSEVAARLEEMNFGIICLTPDNLNAPWIHFEAGALSKILKNTASVCPYLFKVNPTDIQGPLVQFQSANADKQDTKKLVLTINHALEQPNRISESVLEKTFEHLWPELQENLNNISVNNQHSDSRRSDREILEEILGLVRSQSRRGIPVGRVIETTNRTSEEQQNMLLELDWAAQQLKRKEKNKTPC